MQRSTLRAVAAVLAVTALASACASGDSDRARDLAREACANYEMFVPAGADTPEERETAHRRVVPGLEDSARQAAQAARLDSQWRELAQGLARLAEQTSASLELADLRAGAASTSGGTADADELQARVLSLGAEVDAHDPREQCRKAQAS
ncbi:hypothetical protein [Actinacidiphila sp. bgisy160]|uniref:hypothetical protein n=1 Tax=Actinacidiphila sp. bgisy160 TaxID=3413796 RepID=UPI003D70CCF1